ncbi:MAG: 16S rRNA (cytidine(1402)-2'-O)-methyltransferase [Gammaproteobacteria bacterium]|nr:MAG: 16S rRNA (cytidine(1402)-2'-O)-methyltransferase [Gammaproteobacteria bacterium]
MTQGVLYVVATPLGNLGDMVPRAIDILQTVDLIAAEDTRHSRKLLDHFAITTDITAYHDHSTEAKREALLRLLQEGKSLAVISDAGTPLISDPGFKLVQQARQRGVTVVPVPGACAAITALSAAGLPCDRFVFEGFLPAKASARCKALQQIATESRTIVFYESSHRIEASIGDMVTVFGPDRQAVIARELTKLYETIHGDTLQGLQAWLGASPDHCRGEFVVMVAGADPVASMDADEGVRVGRLLAAELPVSQAADLAARITGLPRRAIYQALLKGD